MSSGARLPAGWRLASLLGAAILVAAACPPTGDLHQSYLFAPTGTSMAYRLYVPKRYDGTQNLLLVIVLHGAGGSPDREFTVTPLLQMAEQRGELLFAPIG